MSDSDFYHSSRREKLIEHLFIGQILRSLWLLGIHEVDVLRAETDASGYDLVLEAGSVSRHIQLKCSSTTAATSRQKINTSLALKYSGCVLWIQFDPKTFELGPFMWFGDTPDNPLPDISKFPVAKHTKANKEGIKAERPGIRVISKSKFTLLNTMDDVIKALFGPLGPILAAQEYHYLDKVIPLAKK